MKLSNRFRICAFFVCALAIAVSAQAQIIDSVSLNVERRGHSATSLKDGRVLIVGGENTGGVVSQAEVFDPASNTFLVIGASSGRTDHTATLLADGRVLIAGGRDNSGPLASTEIFNPADNSFSAGPSLGRARAGHTATTLGDGRILLAGGDAAGSAETLDIDHQLASPVGSLAEPRVLHGAGLLKDGRVLIVGGVDPADNAQVLDSAEIFDPQTGQFSSTTTTMGVARALPLVKVLPDGKVQIIGGSADFSMEMFNAESSVFSALAHLPPTPDLLEATLGTESRAALISSAIVGAPALQSALQDPAIAELLDRSDYTVTEIPQTDTALVAGGVNDKGEVLALSALISSSQATVTTDRFDYAPAKTVTITGAGWQPGESVVMVLHEEPETHPDITVTSNADSDGNFINTDFAPASSDMGRTFTVTAVGSISLKSAQTAFTDAASITITKVNGCTLNPGPCGPFTNPIHVEGVASSANFPGNLSQYQVQVNWGDGTVDNDSSINFSCSNAGCTDFSGTWSSDPDHSYAASGPIAITARLYHTNPSGADSAADSASNLSVIVTVTPTVTTAIHNAAHGVITTATAGATVHDSVSVTGTNGTATGTVTFAFYSNGTCTGTPTATSSALSLSSGALDASGFAQGPLAAGSYSFKAHYNGDSHYDPADGACEALTVGKANLTIATTVHNDSGDVVLSGNLPLGGGAHDSATVSGKVGSLTLPDVTFFFFAKGVTCTNGSTTGATALNTVSPDANGVAHPSTSQTALAAGTYNFMAVVASNDNYNGATGNCEPFTVGKATATVATAIHNGSNHTTDVQSTTITLDSTIHDKATVTGNGIIAVTGSVTFKFFLNSTCLNTPNDTSSAQPLTSGVVDATGFAKGPLAAGVYSFLASYSGDDNYNAADALCETVSVGKGTPTVTTAIHNGSNHAADVQGTSLALNSTIHDKATVAGDGTLVPTGSVTFKFFLNTTCAGTPNDTSSAQALTSGAVDATGFAKGPLGAGGYSFLASYSGDTNYNPADALCERVTVGTGIPIVTTAIHNGGNHATDVQGTTIALDSTIHDKATVTGDGALVPTGSVTFKFFLNTTCTGTPNDTSTATLTSGAVDNTGFAKGPLAAGSYSFLASYGGDANYTAADGLCETVTVGKATPSVTTAIHNGGNHAADVQGTTIALDSTIHDKATVTGDGTLVPTGSVTFKFFLNSACSGTPNDTSTAALTSGAVDNTGFTKGPLATGSYSFLASYGGDGNYNAADALCETVSVGKGTPTVTTAIHSGSNHTTDVQGTSLALNSTIHDKATVTGDGTLVPTGSVTFKFFLNSTCAGTPNDTSSAQALTSGAVDATGFAKGPLGAGSYSFLASYNGDTNYNTADALCETVAIGKGTPSLATVIHSGDPTTDIAAGGVTLVAGGATVHDKATITGDGTVTPTGTVTFTFFRGGDCTTGTPETAGTVALLSGVAHPSNSKGPLNPGSYAFKAHYNGDGNYIEVDAACEPLAVSKIDPTVTTDIHDASHTVISFALSGTSVHDSATVSGTLATPTGSVTLKWFSNGTCSATPLATSSALALSSGTVDAASFAQIPDFHVSSTYAFQATYNGDNVYNARTGPCESLSITSRTTQITTSLSGGGQTGTSITVQAGTSVTDSATLNGATANAGGTVTYTIFSDGTCTTVFTSGGTKTVTNGVAPNSNPITFTQSGNFFWKVDYSGDISNASSTSGCSEQVTVLPHSITLTFVGGGFVPKITAPLPKNYKSPGVEVDVSFTDILHDGVRVDVTSKAHNVANNCAKPLTPSTDTLKQFSVPVSQGNLDTVQLAFKLYEVTPTAMNTAKKAKCQSVTLHISQFTAVGVDAQGTQSNTLTLLAEGGLDIIIPLPTKTKSAQTPSERRAAALEEAEFQALPAGTRLPAPDRR